ncbi:MAG TPA: glycosyltransferase family 2 protein [Streptosporangiaceae bacterium]|nr:glycosyltransferase family 2 protein [Streptosporangiaceae bacterium]
MLHERQATQTAGDGAARDREGLSVVIVTYRSAAVIGQCLQALEKALPEIPTQVIVVDNASADDTVAVARAAAPQASIIAQEDNGGFAQGCAAGARAATGRWLLFLNPDTVIAADAIRALLDCARSHPSAGIIGGRFVHEDGTTDPRSWWGKPTPWSALCFAIGLNSVLAGNPIFDREAPRPWTPGLREVRAAPVITGAFMMLRRDLWRELGGFDPVFFMYGEDADLCLRAAKLGYRPVVTAQAVCHHSGGKSSSGAQKMILLFTGKATIVRRHFPFGLRRLGILLLVTGVFVRATASRWHEASAARQGRPTARGEDWRALWAGRGIWRHGWSGSDRPGRPQ